MAKVVIRAALPVERAFADLFRHVPTCYQCSASICLRIIHQAANGSQSKLTLCRTGRRRLKAAVESWSPSTPITVRWLAVRFGSGRRRASQGPLRVRQSSDRR
jgi:hypothetical protein